MGYYLKIRFKEKYNGRKIWYFNDLYLCDCVNTTFDKKEACIGWIDYIIKKPQYPYCLGKNIDSITIHKTKN